MSEAPNTPNTPIPTKSKSQQLYNIQRNKYRNQRKKLNELTGPGKVPSKAEEYAGILT